MSADDTEATWTPSYAERAAGIVKAYVAQWGEDTITSEDLIAILEWIHVHRPPEAYTDVLGRDVFEYITEAFGGPAHRFTSDTPSEEEIETPQREDMAEEVDAE